MKKRFYAVDGLKGLAIVAVIFTHIPLGIWYGSVPKYFYSILDVLLGSGGLGVTIFFILTGFLMGRLYEFPVSPLVFWGRRYARLFPPFLVMVVAFTIFHLKGNLSAPDQVLILLGCMAAMRAVWEMFFKINTIKHLGKWVMVIILGLQICVIVFYTGFLLQVPSAVFYEVWPPILRTLTTAVVNATLTLPFGQYIDQLDGIYWALEAELLFYILYPLWVAPLIYYSKKLSSILKLFGIFALLPFSFGLYLIAQRILGFEMVKIHLIIYFIGGVIIGTHLSWFKEKLAYFKPIIIHPVWFFSILLAVLFSVKLNSFIPTFYRPWLSILMVFPISLLLLTAEDENTYGNKFLSNPVLMFLGKYSYALFLVHSFIIHTVSRFVTANTSLNGFILTICSFLGSIIFAWILYQLTEKPYFTFRKKSVTNTVKLHKIITHEGVYGMRSNHISAISLLVIIAVSSYVANKPPVSLFTLVNRQGGSLESTIYQKGTTLITDKSIKQSFVASENNLGMIMMHIRNQQVEGVTGGFVPFQLYIRLRKENDELISQSTYNAYQIIDSKYHPFGFPIQTDSKGKYYTVEYQLSEKSPSQIIQHVTSEADFLSVYFIDKHSLLKSPQLLTSWMMAKLKEPFTNPMFWFIFPHIFPFLLFLAGVGIVPIKNRKI